MVERAGSGIWPTERDPVDVDTNRHYSEMDEGDLRREQWERAADEEAETGNFRYIALERARRDLLATGPTPNDLDGHLLMHAASALLRLSVSVARPLWWYSLHSLRETDIRTLGEALDRWLEEQEAAAREEWIDEQLDLNP